MTEPQIITPQEAQDHLREWASDMNGMQHLLMVTVATEPDRTRAAVVKVLRDNNWRNPQFGQVADAIENGAPL